VCTNESFAKQGVKRGLTVPSFIQFDAAENNKQSQTEYGPSESDGDIDNVISDSFNPTEHDGGVEFDQLNSDILLAKEGANNKSQKCNSFVCPANVSPTNELREDFSNFMKRFRRFLEFIHYLFDLSFK
jgi:hypothetical protein